MRTRFTSVLRFLAFSFIFLIAINNQVRAEEIPQNQSNTEEVQNHEQEAHEEEHSGNMSPLLFLVIALVIGAATRHWLKNVGIPYTVSLLVIGLLLGLLSRMGAFGHFHIGNLNLSLALVNDAISWAGQIDPHLILYIFLPTLIFEAAFAMDVHTFKKSFGNAFILAVPGILVAIFLTALTVLLFKFANIGLQDWSWQIALLFGVVVSATDPVAVVSILKEMGASKKLGTLIEGESLMNDGTAIVLFMVFLLTITTGGGDTSPFVEFFRVALGGTVVGIVIGWIVIKWVKKVFNDALVEITVIIAAAYITFYVAEHIFHVSGVLGLVALGLMMASVGRTRVSPEVQHFLHEFWELAAFIANTLIFIMVGVVISNRIVFTPSDFLILGLFYVGIHIIRAIVIAIFYPIMKRLGYGLPKKNAYILWWGALRGAVGLALALIVAGEEMIPESIRNQFLFYTAGIVTLTLLVNATTIKALINILGINKIAPAKAAMLQNAKTYLLSASLNNIDKLKRDRFLSKANWMAVADFLPENPAEDEKIETQASSSLVENRRRFLENEKSSYWNQFKDGLLGPIAVRNLSEAINEIIDADGKIPLSERKDLEQLWQTPKFLNKLQAVPVMGKITQRIFFDRLAIGYDTARGFVSAQYDNLKLVEGMMITAEKDKKLEENLQILETEINENRIHGLTFLRNLRNTYPEIYKAITTQQAIRSNLNYEKRTVERLLKKGQIGSDEAAKMLDSIEKRMKILVDSPPEIKPPEKAKLLAGISWLKALDKNTFNQIVNLFQHRNYAVGEKIIKEHGAVDGLYVVARGSVKVTVKGKLLDILGKGSVIGEIAVLTSVPRTATVTAESPVTVLRLTSVNMQQVIQGNQTLEDKLWEIAAPRLCEDILRENQLYKDWSDKDLRNFIDKGEVLFCKKVKPVSLENKTGVLLTGKAIAEDNTEIIAPVLIEKATVTLSRGARLWSCER